MLLQYDWIFGLFSLPMTTLIIIIVLYIVLSLLIQTVFLKLALRVVDHKHDDFGEVFITSLLCMLVSWIPCLGCILCWVIINSRHETGFGSAILVWLISILLALVITIIIIFVVVVVVMGVSLAIPFFPF